MQLEDLITEAIIFAAEAHKGALRKGTRLPYIVHPMEAVSICASITDDPEVLAAAALHDVVEDAGVTVGELEERFGARVAELVAGESEDKRPDQPATDTWQARKEESIAHLRAAQDPAVRVICLGDKLSNIRTTQRDFTKVGEGFWERFNQRDPRMHAWYYRTIAELLEAELGDTEAWREYASRVDAVFRRYE